MPQRVGRGGTINLDAFFRDGTGALVTPVNPRVDIINPSSVEVVSNAVPTELGLGHYSYAYVVAADAPLGIWTAHWTAAINGANTEDDDLFEVAVAGSIGFDNPGPSTCEPWATESDVCSPCDDYNFPAGLLIDTLQTASDVLFELSGRQFNGICESTVRPTARRGGESRPFGWNRTWGWCSCNAARRGGCGSVPEITLGGYPIVSISEVKIDGAILDEARYRIDDDRWLVRLPDADGRNPGWPCCQRMDLADTEDDTFSVTYSYGQAPPQAGVTAAAALACQLALACSPETIGDCRLPQRVTSITREGVTAVVLDPFDFLTDGRTGIYEVDLFLNAYNPSRLRRPPGFVSPDVPRRARRTSTA